MAKAYLYDLTDTWNSAGTTFNAIRMSVTDTASAAGSLLMDLQVGGASKFSVRKDGLLSTAAKAYFASATITLGETATGEVTVRSAGGFGWSPDTTGVTTPDVVLRRDAANTLAQRNGTSAQTFRLYNTYTDASNYERLAISFTGSTFDILTQNAGTGTSRQLRFGVGSVQWAINNSGHFLASTDNTYDIGASGANRPRIGWFGTGLYVGSNGYLRWESRSFIDSPADGVIRLLDNALTSFNRLQFGGTTNAFPALKRDGAGVSIRLADDSAATFIKHNPVTVATLPAAATAGAGARMVVSDALAPVFGSAVAGGGAVVVPVYSTGTAWNVG